MALFAAVAAASCSPVTSSEDANGTTGMDGAATADSATTPDSVGSAVDAASTDADTGGCGSGQVCLPATPPSWTGPVAVDTGSTCPAPYNFSEDVHAGLNAAPAVCGCGCNVNSVDCHLYADSSPFINPQNCTSPPFNDACLTARAVATCQTTPSSSVPAISWDSTATVCDGATAGDSCDEGSCYPGAGSGSVCIMRDGDHACPIGSGYTERTLYHRDANDTRSCTSCSCTTSDQACELDLEICSVGSFNITLKSGGSQHCLSSSDGDGVSQLGKRITANGTCSTSGGNPTGSATPTGPVTVCCRP